MERFSELSQEDVSEVLLRAQEIDAFRSESGADVATFVHAAEEAGISREAVLQALRERTQQPLSGVTVGDKVFAKSADGAFYVSTIVRLDQHEATVRFVGGTDHIVALTDLRRFALVPGQLIQVQWPFYGWYRVKVVSYDSQSEMVLTTDGASRHESSLADIRLQVELSKRELSVRQMLFRTALWAATGGGIVGALLIKAFAK